MDKAEAWRRNVAKLRSASSRPQVRKVRTGARRSKFRSGKAEDWKRKVAKSLRIQVRRCESDGYAGIEKSLISALLGNPRPRMGTWLQLVGDAGSKACEAIPGCEGQFSKKRTINMGMSAQRRDFGRGRPSSWETPSPTFRAGRGRTSVTLAQRLRLRSPPAVW